MSFVRFLAQLSAQQRVTSCTVRRDEYDVNEDGSEDAGDMNNSK